MNKILEGARQASAFAKGEEPAARITINGHAYVPAAVAQHESDCVEAAKAHIEQLLVGLDAALRAADLALFVIRKQDVMPNDSWKAGFERDMATARASRVIQQQAEGSK